MTQIDLVFRFGFFLPLDPISLGDGSVVSYAAKVVVHPTVATVVGRRDVELQLPM